MDAFVSKDQGLLCIEILVPTESLMVDMAWVRVSRGGTQLTCQTIQFEPAIEWMEVVSVEEGTIVATRQPENSRLGIGRPLASQFPAVPMNRCSRPTYHVSDFGTIVTIRTHLTFGSVKDDVTHSDTTEDFRVIKMMISGELQNIFRSEPNFHDIDGACRWKLVLEKVVRKFSKHRSEHSSRRVVGDIPATCIAKVVGHDQTI